MFAVPERTQRSYAPLSLMADVPLIIITGWMWVLMLGIFAARMSHPFDLEWMEGGMLLHGHRVAMGQGLYVIPSSEFIPFIYPPLYSWLLGLGGVFFDVTYGWGRGISVLGTLAGVGALIAAVRGEGGSTAVGMAAGAVFLTTWDDSGTFMDLVRADGLLVGLMSWSLVALRHGWIRAGGALLVLAFMAKQNVAILGVPALLWIGSQWGWSGVRRFLLWCLLPALTFVEWMTLEGDGFFLTYMLEVPSTHPFVFERFWPGTHEELYEALPWMVHAIGAVAAIWSIRFLWQQGWAPVRAHLPGILVGIACWTTLFWGALSLTLWVGVKGWLGATVLQMVACGLLVGLLVFCWQAGTADGSITNRGLAEAKRLLLGIQKCLEGPHRAGLFSVLVWAGFLFFQVAKPEYALVVAQVPWGAQLLTCLMLVVLFTPRFQGVGLYWGSQAALILLMCMAMRGHHGGYLNVLMPGHWMMAALAGMGLGACQRWIPSIFVRIGVTTVLCVQIWQGSQWVKGKQAVDVEVWYPTEADIIAGNTVVETMAEVPGPVLAPWYPWMGVQAGKAPFFHLISLWDIMHPGSPLKPYGQSIAKELSEQKWPTIFGVRGKKLGYKSAEHYRNAGTILPKEQRVSISYPPELDSDALRSKTGWAVRPGSVMIPKVRHWKPRLPKALTAIFELKDLRAQWQGVWMVTLKSGAKEIWVIEKKKRSVYRTDSDGALELKRQERFDVVSPCAVGVTALPDGRLPKTGSLGEYNFHAFSLRNSDEIWVGTRGVAVKPEGELLCETIPRFKNSQQRLEWRAETDATGPCQAWSAFSDQVLSQVRYRAETDGACTIVPPTKEDMLQTLIRQESLAVAEDQLRID